MRQKKLRNFLPQVYVQAECFVNVYEKLKENARTQKDFTYV